MKINKEQKRKNAIKLKPVFFPTKCQCCGDEYYLEKMWTFWRYGVNMRVFKWHFCQNCMHSVEDVLNEIDTDEVIFGLAWVDEHVINKKDYTRMNKLMTPHGVDG